MLVYQRVSPLAQTHVTFRGGRSDPNHPQLRLVDLLLPLRLYGGHLGNGHGRWHASNHTWKRLSKFQEPGSVDWV